MRKAAWLLVLIRGACSQPLPAALEQLRSLGSRHASLSRAPSQESPQAATVTAGGGIAPSGSTDSLKGLGSKAAQVALAAVPVPERCKSPLITDSAVVTLITNNEGYPAGALALAASLEVQDSALRRIVLVTAAVADGIRDLLRSASWEVR